MRYDGRFATRRRPVGGWRSVALAGALSLGVLGTGVAAVLAQGSSRATSPSRSRAASVRPRQAPTYDPARFTPRVDNAWYPLKPGITYIYRGAEGSHRARNVVRVTDQVATIAGVQCRVVKDNVFLDGRLEERTIDYYTQDEDGNVWYFGEDTEELDENGNVISREGSWRTGRHGAEAGFYMEANPQVGDTFQQEFYRNHAEDHYEVLSLTREVRVPFGHFGGNSLRRNVQVTKEWTPLEPEVRDLKYYVRGIGQVREVTARGRPVESLKLVRIVAR
jgi:hypothetical protein